MAISGWVDMADYAVGDDTDRTTDFQSGVTQAVTDGNPLYIPGGTYRLSDTIDFTGDRMMVFCSPNAVFKWVESTAGNLPVFKFFGATECVWTNGKVTFLDDTGVYASAVFLMETKTGETMSRNCFENIKIEGDGTTERYDYGFHWTAGSGGNNNNDLSIVRNCVVQHYDKVGFLIDMSQSTGHRFEHCSMGSAYADAIGIQSDGSFDWYGGTSFVGNDKADFLIDAAISTQPVKISGYRSEGSGNLLDCQIGSSMTSVTLDGCSFNSAGLRTDKHAVHFAGRSHFTMRNCVIGSSTSDALEIHLQSTGNQNAEQFLVENTKIISSLEDPFTGRKPQCQENVQVNTGTEYYLGSRRGHGKKQLELARGYNNRSGGGTGNELAYCLACDVPDAERTSNATETLLAEYPIPDGYAGVAKFHIIAREQGSKDIQEWDFKVEFENTSGTVTLSGNESSSSWDPNSLAYTVDVVSSTKYVQVKVTGKASTSINWSCMPFIHCTASF